MDDLFFFIGLSLLFTHEMDAVKHREWRLLPGMWHLDDANGFLIFTAAHIPISLLLFISLFSGVEDVRQKLIMGLHSGLSLHRKRTDCAQAMSPRTERSGVRGLPVVMVHSSWHKRKS